MNILDKWQQAWQSQCAKPLDIDADQLLKTARLQLTVAGFERWAHFVLDMFVIMLLLIPGIWMLGRIRDIHRDWPWILYCACIACVVGFMLFTHWRRRRYAPRYDEPMLVHVEWTIKDIEHRIWQQDHTFWWYTLPLALGCTVPATIVIGLQFLRTHNREFLFGLLFALVFFPAFFAAVHWFVMRVQRMRPVVESQRRQLESLRALRESLLNPEAPHDSGETANEANGAYPTPTGTDASFTKLFIVLRDAKRVECSPRRRFLAILCFVAILLFAVVAFLFLLWLAWTIFWWAHPVH
jgi:hypothetical protein